MTQKLVSVVILNWNGRDLLRRYLPSVIAHTPKALADIVVVDNGSTDDSCSVVKNEFPEVVLIEFKENHGFSKGYNLAIQEIKTPYTVLLNSDCGVAPQWLEHLVEFAEAHPEAAALQPKLLSDREHSSFEYAGAAGGYLDRFGYPYCRGRIFDVVESDLGQYDTVRPVMWATGACLMVRTELYNKVGGLDENFFAHMEEIDLAWRMRRLGYHLYCIPQSVAYHLGGASLSMGHPRKTYLNFRNSLLMLYKNIGSPSRCVWTLAARCCLDIVASANFIVHGEWKHASAVAKANRDAFCMIRKIYKKQKREDSIAKHQNNFKEEKICILTQYYLRRKKSFSDIFPQ